MSYFNDDNCVAICASQICCCKCTKLKTLKKKITKHYGYKYCDNMTDTYNFAFVIGVQFIFKCNNNAIQIQEFYKLIQR